MRPEEVTQTIGGLPIRIYAIDGGYFRHMIHGAIWIRDSWQMATWDSTGEIFDGPKTAKYNLDLNLHNWKDEIPWKNLDPRIMAIARDDNGPWFGYDKIPCLRKDGWLPNGPFIAFLMRGLYIPNSPEDWTQTLAVRPEAEEESSF